MAQGIDHGWDFLLNPLNAFRDKAGSIVVHIARLSLIAMLGGFQKITNKVGTRGDQVLDMLGISGEIFDECVGLTLQGGTDPASKSHHTKKKDRKDRDDTPSAAETTMTKPSDNRIEKVSKNGCQGDWNQDGLQQSNSFDHNPTCKNDDAGNASKGNGREGIPASFALKGRWWISVHDGDRLKAKGRRLKKKTM